MALRDLPRIEEADRAVRAHRGLGARRAVPQHPGRLPHGSHRFEHTPAFGFGPPRRSRSALLREPGGGSLTNEKSYLLGEFARVALGTSNIDYNGRFCMSSAAAAGIRALGIDRGLPFPVADIARAGTALLIGGNPAETMPPIMQYFEEQKLAGGSLIVADPRRTLTARAATLHLRLEPGTDAALANGLLHVLVRDGLIDEDYVARRTEGFEQAKAAAAYWPGQVERITGVPEAQQVQAAHMLGKAGSAMALTGAAARSNRRKV